MPFKPVAPDKVKLTSALAGLTTYFLLDVLIQRPNRIAAGEGFTLLETGYPLLAGSILLCWITIIALSFLPKKKISLPTSLSSLSIIALTFWSVGEFANQAAMGDNPFVRVSMGSGAWVMTFSSLILIMDCFHHSEKGVREKAGYLLIPSFLFGFLLMSGHLDNLSLVQEFVNRKDRFWGELIVHLQLSFGASCLSAFIGIPLGIFLTRRQVISQQSFFVLNIIQTIPSIALFAMLIAPLAYLSSELTILQAIGFQGVGWAPALIALFLYSLLPIVRNTYTGLLTIDDAVVESAYGMGMTNGQVLRKVKLPLASGVILNGFRVATVQSIGNTAVAALIGAGGFGIFIFQGLGQAATDLILLGAIPTIFIAVCTDLILQGVINTVAPRSTS